MLNFMATYTVFSQSYLSSANLAGSDFETWSLARVKYSNQMQELARSQHLLHNSEKLRSKYATWKKLNLCSIYIPVTATLKD